MKTIYSVFSGTFYDIPDDDIKHLQLGQLPVTKKPASGCKSCYGRGNIGRDKTNLNYYICKCVRKNLDMEQINVLIQKGLDYENILK
jgi:hypothetical protein